MNKKTIRLAAGIGVMLLLFGVWFGLRKINEDSAKKQEAEDAPEAVLNLADEEVTAISFQVGDEEKTFLKKEDGWELESDQTFPVNESRIEELISAFCPLSAVRTIEDALSIDNYGLDQPKNVFTLKTSDGTEHILTIGEENEGTGDQYAMLDQKEKTVYTIASSSVLEVSEDLYDYALSEELPSLSSANMRKVIVQNGADTLTLEKKDGEWINSDAEDAVPKEKTVDLQPEEEQEELQPAEAPKGGSDDETSADDLENLVEGLENLSYTGYVDHNCTEDSKYGFDESRKLTIFYSEESSAEAEELMTETEEGAEEIVNKEETGTEKETGDEKEDTPADTLELLIGDQTSEGEYYVRQAGSGEVHLLSAEIWEKFTAAM